MAGKKYTLLCKYTDANGKNYGIGDTIVLQDSVIEKGVFLNNVKLIKPPKVKNKVKTKVKTKEVEVK